ncbi:MAG: TetR/AcrR family transcriptional regulator [Aeromicrobium sp.]|uniref:TetR/AcrR family transcriptional regulator n=1 Tax=Aeromicrobium sp. TaxID=1871063 RepID=UPI0039E2F209
MARNNAGTKGVPRAERWQQILDIASLAFGTDGFAATNIADIARSAGISKPLIYNYFGSKEGLYVACVDEAGELLAGEMERVARGDVVGVERGLRTLDAMFTILEDRRHLWRLLHDRSAPSTGEVASVITHHTRRIDALAHEGVSELLALSGDPDALDASALTAVWIGIVDALMDWWVAHPDETAAHMSERIGRVVGALLADIARLGAAV